MFTLASQVTGIPFGYEHIAIVDPDSGRIFIDGVDITTIRLHDLRSRVVVELLARSTTVAPALWGRSSIIVLDEATSSIDIATDQMIQATIRDQFGAHYLLGTNGRRAVLGSRSRTSLEDCGRLTYDRVRYPVELGQKENGIFRHKALKSRMFAELDWVAEERLCAALGFN
ncbi:hypothetical protein EI94DRAFT_1787263 [Lactarius quietus]|nr:hypothetical protein EI94DRAFT_1787263 [Lactarius quietus]